MSVRRRFALIWPVSLLTLAIVAVRADDPPTDDAERPAPRYPDTIRLSKELVQKLGLRVEPAKTATHPATLRVRGSLALDPNAVARVRSRFAGEIVEVGTIKGADGQPRPLQPGDPVAHNQLLAVVWSHELSERKNDLLEDLSKQRVERDRYQRVEGLHKSGAIAEREFVEVKRALESAEIAVAREERSLRAQGVSAEEIAIVHAEAEAVHDRHKRSPYDPEKSWARTRLVSPIEGRVLDVSVVDGDIVTANEMLFRVADTRRLIAHVKVHEADLAQIETLPKPLTWSLHPRGLPHTDLRGSLIDAIGVLVDPRDHSATLSGRLDNTSGKLHPGQAIQAEIELPAGPDLVEIPASARLRDEGRDFVLVEIDPDGLVFSLRPVRIVREAPGLVMTRTDPDGGIEPGERIVVEGAAKLRAALEGSDPADLPRP